MFQSTIYQKSVNFFILFYQLSMKSMYTSHIPFCSLTQNFVYHNCNAKKITFNSTINPTHVTVLTVLIVGNIVSVLGTHVHYQEQ